LRYLRHRNRKKGRMDARIATEPMLHNQKILSFGDQIAGGRRVRCSALRGCAQLLPIAALIRPLVNFDVEACTRDIIMTAAPGRGREHGHRWCKGDLCKTPRPRPAGMIAAPKSPLVCTPTRRDPSVKEQKPSILPSYLDIIACVARLSRSPSFPAIAHCSLCALPVCVSRCKNSAPCGSVRGRRRWLWGSWPGT
jgi:hypothetical protein